MQEILESLCESGDEMKSKKMRNMFYSLLKSKHKSGNALCFIGVYLEDVKDDIKNAVKYYLKAAKKNNCVAMFKLGCYYHREDNYDEMKKYYLMAINLDHVPSMYYLAVYYHEEENADAKKYYAMAIDKGCVSAMRGMASYYRVIEKKYGIMMKYYLMAISEGGSFPAIYELADYYKEIKHDDSMMSAWASAMSAINEIERKKLKY